MTVHMSQGATYGTVVYDYKRHPQKLVYVGISRCTNIEKLYLTNRDKEFKFNHGVANAHPDMTAEFARLYKYRLDTVSATCKKAVAEVDKG